MSPAPARVVGGFRWNAATQRYIDPAGRFVARERVRAAVDVAITSRQSDLRAISLRLRSGTITVDQWRAAMGQAVKDVHLFSVAAARGGWAQMTPSDYGRVGAAVKKQYAFLDRFVGEIDAGYNLAGGRFLNRALSYADAGRLLYAEVVADAMADAGFDEERNVQTATESCAGCIDQTRRGWVQLGGLIPVGERDPCRRFCKCFIQYRRSQR